ncbi:MAG: MmcQ/YjbR family DNA-binding protein [Dysgonamonadaceae bacterium]|jgi:predicted DNA-binding protein (MmcQ/YjbR family)|nr:MmcQ/YjbR family DNA-binding protein [Dysgonamonadaceae bacterium]
MNVEELYEICMSIKGAEDTFPFDDVSLVFKVMGKMFALLPLDADSLQITLKCDPDVAVELREQYTCVEAAYHFNKKYWNTIYVNGTMSKEEIVRWVNHSVAEVIKKLPKNQQLEYEHL